MYFRFVEHVRGGAHVDVKVWAGKTPGSLGLCGGLVMRPNEWAIFKAALILAERTMGPVIEFILPEDA